ncbi:MAG: hypothetical protein ACFFD4_34265 [Candidatus Odinarchaeota archaeon]
MAHFANVTRGFRYLQLSYAVGEFLTAYCSAGISIPGTQNLTKSGHSNRFRDKHRHWRVAARPYLLRSTSPRGHYFGA